MGVNRGSRDTNVYGCVLPPLPSPPLPSQGVAALPTDNDSLFHWNAKIEGLGGTPWEGESRKAIIASDEKVKRNPNPGVQEVVELVSLVA